MRVVLLLLATLALVSATVPAALADDVGAVGTVAAVDVNTPSADTFLLFNGELTVRTDSGAFDMYRWGGTSCGTKLLTEAQVESLQRALGDKRVRIRPLHLPGQGQVKCLVGFLMVSKSYAKSLLP